MVSHLFDTLLSLSLNAGIVKKEKGLDLKILGTGLDVMSLFLQKNKSIKCQMFL